jgi:glycosyltransferase involved in cell wall biosynthesis
VNPLPLSEPLVSVIVPVRNGEATLGACLGALRASTYPRLEILVVDDGSTDRSPAIAQSLADRVIRLTSGRGAAAARNAGVRESKGEILLFIDADVVAEPQTVRQVVENFRRRPELDATFGLYRQTTQHKNFFSVFKNLIHHYTHLTSAEDAWTFWSGCGAIRRAVFETLGGFDESYMAVEDIELGYRLWQGGFHVSLDKELGVTHCKRYGLWSLVHSDFMNRAVPWTRLMLERRVYRSDLNLTLASAASVVIAYLLVLTLLASVLYPALLVLFVLLAAVFVRLNRRFYLYVWKLEGTRFMLGAVLMHFFYFLYGGTGLAAGGLAYLGSRHRK